MGSVLQKWVEELPLRAQGTLLTAVRGCDDEAKRWTSTGVAYSPGSPRKVGEDGHDEEAIRALAIGWANESEALYAKVEAAKCLCKRDGPVDECPLHGEMASRNDYNIGYADGIDNCALDLLSLARPSSVPVGEQK